MEAGDEAEFTLVLAVLIPQQQRVADKVEDGRIGARVAVLRLGHGLLDSHTIFVGGAASLRIDVGAVDVQAGDDFADDEHQAVQREVAVAAVARSDVAQQIRKLVHLAGQRDEHDHLLGRVGQVLEALRALTQEAEVDRAEELFVLAGDKQPVEVVQVLVAGRSVDTPVRPQALEGLEDLLHDDVEASFVGSKRRQAALL